MDVYIDQISNYFESLPFWPLALLAFAGVVALAFDAVNRKRHEEAIAIFRETLETELASMYPKHIRWPENVNNYLCSRLPEMQHNFEVLRVFIPQKQLLSYNTAWNKYCDFCRSITDEKCAASEQSSGNASGSQSPANEDLKKEFHTLVSDLLEFAKK